MYECLFSQNWSNVYTQNSDIPFWIFFFSGIICSLTFQRPWLPKPCLLVTFANSVGFLSVLVPTVASHQADHCKIREPLSASRWLYFYVCLFVCFLEFIIVII